MASEYRLQALMDFRRKRAESLKTRIESRRAEIEEQQRMIEALEAEEGLLGEPAEIESRKQAITLSREMVATLQREQQQEEKALEDERKELWVLQMHKDLWKSEQP